MLPCQSVCVNSAFAHNGHHLLNNEAKVLKPGIIPPEDKNKEKEILL